MAITERLALLVTLDAQGAIKGFNDLGKAADRNLGKSDQRLDRLASSFQKAGAGMLAGAGLAAAGLYKAGQAAGELEQAMGGTEAVFGDASAVIDDFAKKAAQAAGLSESAFRTATTSIGGQLKGLGFSVTEAADQAVKLTQVAADLTATYGGTTAEAVAALGAAFRGEADPAERFNLFLNQTRVNAKAVELGLAATTSEVSAHAKAQATLQLITEQSADALGQFSRESDTAQGSMAIFRAESENLLATIGSAVAPVLADIAGGMSGLVEAFNELSPAQQDAVSKFALFGTATLGAAGALSFTVGKVIDARERFSQLTSALTKADGGISKFGLAAGGVVAGVGLFAAAMFKAQSRADDLRRAAAELREEAEATGKSLSDVAIAKLVETFSGSDDVRRSMDELGLSFADLRGPVTGSEADFEAWRTELIRTSEAGGVVSGAAATVADRVGGLRAELAEARTVTDATSDAMRALGIETDTAGGPIGETTSAIERQKEALDLAKESMDEFKRGLEEAFGDLDVQAATDRRASDLQDIADRFADAQESVESARRRLAELQAIPVEDRGANFGADVAAAQKDLQDAIDETSRSLEGNSAAALTNREELRKVTDDIGKIIEAHRTEGASLEELQRIRDIEKLGLIDQLNQLGYNQDEIGEYIAAIDAIPLNRATTITADTAPAILKVQALLDVISAVPGSIDAAVADRNLQRQAAAENRRAIGGPVTAGVGYSTNEYLGAGKGFEWFAPANGTVYPAGSAMTGATSQVNNVTIVNPTQEPASTSIRKVRGELVA